MERTRIALAPTSAAILTAQEAADSIGESFDLDSFVFSIRSKICSRPDGSFSACKVSAITHVL